jgi:hypothetical protein
MQSRRGTRCLCDSLGGKPGKLVTPSHGARFDKATADNIDERAPTGSKSRRTSVGARRRVPSYALAERL